MKRITLASIAFFMLAAHSWGNDRYSCLLMTNPSDWSNLKYGSADHHLKIIDEYCQNGDSLMIKQLRTSDLPVMVALACDLDSQVIITSVSETLSSLTCKISMATKDRLD